ncbi:MAG: glycine/sarcosine/betaine reductase complex component C subunit beta, partial [Gaiellaceae bacterium]
MTGAAVHACSLVLAHAPDLVRHGSKPARELAVYRDGLLGSLSGALRTYEEAVGYPPHQVLLGNLRPDALWEIERPWWRNPVAAKREGPFGVVIDEEELYRRMVEADAFGLLKLDANEPHDGALTIFQRGRVAGSMNQAHDLDESLSAPVLLENLACKTTGALALEHVLRTTGFPPEELPYVIGSGEEAVGDRYQRGGGNLAKAIAEQAGCSNASGSDVKAFCCGPLHALVVAAALVASGVYPYVAVVAGGSLAKLGMKFAGALRHGVPVLEDVLAGFAVLVGPPGDGAPVVRLDAVGRHRVGSGSAQQAVLEDLVVEPLE